MFLESDQRIAFDRMVQKCSGKRETIILIQSFFTSLDKDWSERISMLSDIEPDLSDLEIEIEEPFPLVRHDLSAAILQNMTAMQIRLFALARLPGSGERRAYEIEVSKVETKDDLISLTLAFLKTSSLEKVK